MNPLMKPFSFDWTDWVIAHLETLREGRWPDCVPCPGYAKNFSWAGFEGPAGIAAVVTSRLDKCGMDGALVYMVKAFGCDEGTVAKMWDIDIGETRGRMNRVIAYCSGQKPKAPYQEWRNRRALDRAMTRHNCEIAG